MWVLLVDDDPLLIDAWARDLRMHRVVVASNRAEAFERARSHPFEVAVIDAWLGTENGIDLVASLRSLGAAPHIFFVSAAMDGALAAAGFAVGADYCINKPRRWTEILAALADGETPSFEDVRPATLHEIEGIHIAKALRRTGNNIARAAAELGIRRTTLQRKLEKRGWHIHHHPRTKD